MEHILKLLGQTKSIPPVFIDYTKEILLDVSLKSRYRDMLIQSPTETVILIGILFDRVSTIINCSSEELLQRLQFKINDKDQTKLGSIFAEMRAIVFLDNMDFDSIQLIKPNRHEKSADFCAMIGNRKFAIEVTNLSFFVTRGKWRLSEVKELCLKKIIEGKKLEQLDNTKSKERCDAQLLIFVIDAIDILALNSIEDFYLLSDEILHALNRLECFYLGIVTGQSSFQEVVDVIYPILQ